MLLPMKSAIKALFAAAVIILLAGCGTESKPPQKSHPAQVSGSPSPSPTPVSQVSPTPSPSPSPTPTLAAPTPTLKPTTGNLPYGTPVPGKPGFVVSPYSTAG